MTLGRGPLPSRIPHRIRRDKGQTLSFGCATELRDEGELADQGNLKHAVGIRVVCGHCLSHVPQLCDSVALEAEDVNDGYAEITLSVADVRMNDNVVAVGQDPLDVKLSVRSRLGGAHH